MARILKRVHDLQVLEMAGPLPGAEGIDKYYEIEHCHHYVAEGKVQSKWIILRVIINKDVAAAKARALQVFENLTKLIYHEEDIQF